MSGEEFGFVYQFQLANLVAFEDYLMIAVLLLLDQLELDDVNQIRQSQLQSQICQLGKQRDVFFLLVALERVTVHLAVVGRVASAFVSQQQLFDDFLCQV